MNSIWKADFQSWKHYWNTLNIYSRKNIVSDFKELTKRKSESSFNFHPFNSPQFYILYHAEGIENYKDKDNEKKHIFVITKNSWARYNPHTYYW